MARIPDSEIERLKVEVSLIRLIETSGVKLVKRGADMVGACPFHADDTPSLSVSATKNLFRCFGCDVGGGPIDWVMKREGVSFRHAVELLRDGAPLDAAPASSSPTRSTVRRLAAPVSMDADDQALLAQVIGYYHETLKGSAEALAYLKARGLDHPELVERFRLGLADRTLGLRLPEKNRKAGADIRARLERIGLYRESGHEHFTGSLVVPIAGDGGVVTEVYGRKIRNNLRAGTPLHLYLPGPHRGVWNLDGIAASNGEVKGMDANDYALKVTPASRSLGVLIRKAEWLGEGKRPEPTSARTELEAVLAAPVATEEGPSLLAAEPTLGDVESEPVLASPLPSLPAADEATVKSEQELAMVLGDRRYRVRGCDIAR